MKMPSAAAVEESCHAFVARDYGGIIRRCQVFSDGSGRHKADGLSRRSRLRVKIAGLVGRRVVFGATAEAHPDISKKDVFDVAGVALKIVRAGEARRLAARGLDSPDEKMLARYEARAEKRIVAYEHEVEALLAANRPAVLALAARLDADGSLSHEQIAAIVAGATAGAE